MITPILIETINDDSTREWGISFTSPNPEEKDYVGCATKEDAAKLLAKIAEIASPNDKLRHGGPRLPNAENGQSPRCL